MKADQAATKTGRDRSLVLVAMCLALATVVSAVSSLNVALPDIARDLHASLTQLQWVVDAYAVVFSGLLLLAGALGDRIGRRPLLLGGLVLFAVAAACGLVARTPGALIATRAVMGIAAAGIMPATRSIITNVFPAGERAVSIWAGVAAARSDKDWRLRASAGVVFTSTLAQEGPACGHELTTGGVSSTTLRRIARRTWNVHNQEPDPLDRHDSNTACGLPIESSGVQFEIGRTARRRAAFAQHRLLDVARCLPRGHRAAYLV